MTITREQALDAVEDLHRLDSDREAADILRQFIEQSPAAPVGAEPLTDDDLNELAYSAHGEAMSFGLSHETFLRYFKTIRSRAALATPPIQGAGRPQQPDKADLTRDCVGEASKTALPAGEQ